MIRNLMRPAQHISAVRVARVQHPRMPAAVVGTRSYAKSNRNPMSPQDVDGMEISAEDRRMMERDRQLIMKYIDDHPDLASPIHDTAMKDKAKVEKQLATAKSTAETDQLQQKIADLEATLSSLKQILDKKSK